LTKQATIAYSIDTRPPNRSGEATRSDEREEDEARRGTTRHCCSPPTTHMSEDAALWSQH